MKKLVIVKGGGDLASGVVHRLYRSGFEVVITELTQPTAVRRTVSFAQAVYSGKCVVESVEAVKANINEVPAVLATRRIPVIIDEVGECIKRYQPWSVIDAIIAKRNTGTRLEDASLVIGLGPGLQASVEVHAVVETMRGHDLGRVIIKGSAMHDTGIPGEVGGCTVERLLRAPCSGTFRGISDIGEIVTAGQIVAYVDSQPVTAAITGILRGVINKDCVVHHGMKIGDIDPRCKKEQCFTISDKARAIGGGVLEALLWLGRRD